MSESQRFLDALERELALELPASLVHERVAEIAAHLDEAVEAYRQMDLEETVAVCAMGPPRLLAQGVARVASAAWDRLRLRLAAFALAGFGANLAGISLLDSPLLTKVVAVLSIAATFGVAYASFRARRPSLLAIFAAGAALILPMLTTRTVLWLNMPYPEGRGNLPRRFVGLRQRDLLRHPKGAERESVLRDLAESTAEPWTLQAARQLPHCVADAAFVVAVVGGADLFFGVLGLAALTLRRRRVVA